MGNTWKKNNPEKIAEYNKKYRNAHRDEFRAYDNVRTAKYPRRATYYHWKRYFGITKEDYENMKAQQNGICKLCDCVLEGGKKESLDHDHNTNKVRAILCRKCNLGIGHFNDDIALFKKAIAYIESYQDSDIVSTV